MAEPSPTREQAEALEWLAYRGPDTRSVRMLEAARIIRSLVAAVSRLEAERDALEKLVATVSASAKAHYEARVAAEAQVAALVRAINEERGWATGTAEHNDARTALYALARQAEALAGGGRTPTGTDSGGLRLDAEAVAEVGEMPRLDPYCLDPEMVCADFPDVRVMDAERLEIALRKVMDEDEACDGVQVVLREGWRSVSPGAADVAEAGE